MSKKNNVNKLVIQESTMYKKPTNSRDADTFLQPEPYVVF